MKIIFPGIPTDHPNIDFLHKSLARERRSHSIRAGSHGFFHEVRGRTELTPASIFEIYEGADLDEIKELLTGLDWSDSAAEFISIFHPSGKEMILLKGWSISNTPTTKEKEDV